MLKMVFVVITGILLTTGCTVQVGDGSTEPSPTPSASANPMNPEDIFLDVVRTEHPIFESVPDAQLIELAHAGCDALAAGVPIEELMLQILTNVPGQESEYSFLLGAGIQSFCPEYASTLDNSNAA